MLPNILQCTGQLTSHQQRSYLALNVNDAEAEELYLELIFLRQHPKNKSPVNDSTMVYQYKPSGALPAIRRFSSWIGSWIKHYLAEGHQRATEPTLCLSFLFKEEIHQILVGHWPETSAGRKQPHFSHSAYSLFQALGDTNVHVTSLRLHGAHLAVEVTDSK